MQRLVVVLVTRDQERSSSLLIKCVPSKPSSVSLDAPFNVTHLLAKITGFKLSKFYQFFSRNTR